MSINISSCKTKLDIHSNVRLKLILSIKNERRFKMRSVDDMNRMTYSFKSKYSDLTMDMPVRIYYPSDYEKSDKKYPVLLFFHGYGEIGKENEKQIRVLQKPNMLLDMVVERDNTIIIAPQCYDPAEYNWVAINHVWATGNRQSLPVHPTIALEGAFNLLYDFMENKKVDESRIYVAGISMGGYACWEALAWRPDIFAAAIPVCGCGILDSVPKLKNVGIKAFHGKIDGTVPCTGTMEMVEKIKQAGNEDCEGTYFDRVGHDSWNSAYSTPGLVDWMLSKKK